ncbi:4-hydroxybenzoate octaprenyltransferase [Parashewanella spongiae]|uniref:4-hydroxybenzoate octaprenyltransferase n=1 Tax=Parashewanella spongiae TaxID=342950 RepID=A0A3A6U586_9GAMM|nr:4-hydroxybenzoate octaprenyltransferase [Parashewanella spongiae]MCL1078942.1 4-hydroxybenzoate octaprenyltransferase [Parashewanella spongiae]RJY19363.1 4-hydroxybenzoate octaprenyltransferase [Parashewanella spongiae]
MTLTVKLSAYWRLARLDKPIGTLLLLWPCLMALFFASEGIPETKLLLIFTVGVIVMRACGCIINDFADRKVDGHVERTKNRPIANGEVGAKEALILFAVLGIMAFALVLTLNETVIKLAFVGIAMTVIYPFLKRVTHLPQLFLGIVFSWSIPMASAAVSGELASSVWWLFFANWCWIVAYDTMYAMVDREDDLKIGIKSTAILFGRHDRLIIGLLQLLTLIGLWLAGRAHESGLYYQLGLVAFVGFSIYQQYLIFHRDRGQCFKAFLNNHWAGFTMFVALLLDYFM